MKTVKRSIPLWAVILAILSVVSVALAAIVLQRQIQMTAHIKAYGLTIYDVDGVTELTSLNLGNLTAPSTTRFPSAGSYFINNTGEMFINKLSFNTTNMPEYMSIVVYIQREDQTSYSLLQENELWTVGLSNDNEARDSALWYFELTDDSSAVSQDVSFTMNWFAYGNT